jgi:GntR family transcriptional regulator
MSRSQPLYHKLANALRTSIFSGVYEHGGLLPTELELCSSHNVSRHTARDALRLLSDEGLITRKRGAGTRVVSSSPVGPFSQEWGDIGDILQYARDTRLLISTFGAANLDDVVHMGLDSDCDWMMVKGIRMRVAGGPLIALTTICVRADLMPTRDIVEAWPQALGEYIASHNQVRAARIEQEISAICLDRPSAKALGERVGDPALRTLRRYISSVGLPYLASISIHPGDRFSYKMSVER